MANGDGNSVSMFSVAANGRLTGRVMLADDDEELPSHGRGRCSRVSAGMVPGFGRRQRTVRLALAGCRDVYSARLFARLGGSRGEMALDAAVRHQPD